MEVEKIVELFEKYSEENEYNAFSKLPPEQKPHPRKDIAAFILLDKILRTNPNIADPDEDILAAAEHDEVYLAVDLEDLAETEITEEDIKLLEMCGVMVDESDDCLKMFV